MQDKTDKLIFRSLFDLPAAADKGDGGTVRHASGPLRRPRAEEEVGGRGVPERRQTVAAEDEAHRDSVGAGGHFQSQR